LFGVFTQRKALKEMWLNWWVLIKYEWNKGGKAHKGKR